MSNGYTGKLHGVWIPLKLFPHSPAPSMRAMVSWQIIRRIEPLYLDRFRLHFREDGIKYVTNREMGDIIKASNEYKHLRAWQRERGLIG